MRVCGYMALTERGLTIPEIMLIGGTRAALGVGIGLLIADRLNKDQRKAAGWALLAVGVLTTFPIVRGVLAKPQFAPVKRRFSRENDSARGTGVRANLIGSRGGWDGTSTPFSKSDAIEKNPNHAVSYIAAATLHFMTPAPYLRMMPPYIPWHAAMARISGAFEILGGLGLLVAETRGAAAWGLVVLLIAVFPANVYMAMHPAEAGGADFAPVLRWGRLPLQAVLIWCCCGVRALVTCSAEAGPFDYLKCSIAITTARSFASRPVKSCKSSSRGWGPTTRRFHAWRPFASRIDQCSTA